MPSFWQASLAADLARGQVYRHLLSFLQVSGGATHRDGAATPDGVEEDRRDLGGQNHTALALVGDRGNVLADPPDQRVGGGLAAGAGAHDVSHEEQRQVFARELHPALDEVLIIGAGAEDALRVQRDVVASGCLLGGREEVGVDLPCGSNHRPALCHRDLGPVREPAGLGPAGKQAARGLAASLGQLGDLLQIRGRDQEEVLEEPSCLLGLVAPPAENLDHRRDVVSAAHGRQHLQGLGYLQVR